MHNRTTVVAFTLLLLSYNASLADVAFDFDGPDPMTGWTETITQGQTAFTILDAGLADLVDPALVDSDMELKFATINNTDNQSEDDRCDPDNFMAGTCQLDAKLTSPDLRPVVGAPEYKILYQLSVSQPSDSSSDNGRISLVSKTGGTDPQSLNSWGDVFDSDDDVIAGSFEVPLDAAIVNGGDFNFQVELGDFDSTLSVGEPFLDSITFVGVELVPEPTAAIMWTCGALGLCLSARRRLARRRIR